MAIRLFARGANYGYDERAYEKPVVVRCRVLAIRRTRSVQLQPVDVKRPAEWVGQRLVGTPFERLLWARDREEVIEVEVEAWLAKKLRWS